MLSYNLCNIGNYIFFKNPKMPIFFLEFAIYIMHNINTENDKKNIVIKKILKSIIIKIVIIYY